jgi:hypothetical protein
MNARSLSLSDLLAMNNRQLAEVMQRSYPIDTTSLDDTCYMGVDLSLPDVLHKLLWQTFRKTFHRDPETGELRGWNVRVEQTGWDRPITPMTDRKGRQLTFGHYQVLPAAGLNFPRHWTGSCYLDYRHAGNTLFDFMNFGYCPLVAVNEGSSELLLGWEVFKVGPAMLALPDYWVLKREGPLADVVPPPRPAKRRARASSQ